MATRIEAEAARAKRDDLQHSPGHCHVLEKVDELILIAEVHVET
jgi:hypothetical protein